MKTNRKVCWLLTAWCALAGMLGSLCAESDQGGVLLTKPFTWSANSAIDAAYEFKSLVDHTGYFSLDPGPQERQVQVGLVADVIYDANLTAKNIASETDLAPLRAVQARLETLSAGSATARTALARRLATVKAEIAYFQQGYLKIDGQWVSTAEINRRREQAQAAQQKARQDADGKELVEALAQRDNTPERCGQIVEKLKTLHKADDPAAQRLLARLQDDKTAVSEFKTEAQTCLQAAAKSPAVTALVNAKTPGQLPTLPADLTQRAADLQNRLDTVEGNLYYQALRDQLHSEAVALVTWQHLSLEITKFKASDLRGAATAVAALSQADAAALMQDYPALAAADKNARSLLVAAAEEFVNHCKKGMELQKLGKTADAIEEYKKAADISKEPEILKEIEDLRQQSLGL